MSQTRCFLHIGAPKTGSTMLQRVLFENQGVLVDRGIRYPSVSLRGFGHHDIAFLVGGGYPQWATPQSKPLEILERELSDELTGWNGSVLLSSEDFYLYPNPQGLRNFLLSAGALAGRDPRIVVYVRKQDDAYESWYNQTIKAQGYTHNVDECLRDFRDLFDYEKRLADWEAAFGHEAILVRPYQVSEFVGGDLLQDFLATIGVDPYLFGASDPGINTSLNRDLLEFQRALNNLPVDIPKKRTFHHKLIELSNLTRGTGIFDERPVLDASARERIMHAYADGNRRVAERYLSRSELFSGESDLARNHAPDEPARLTVEKLSAILGWLFLRDESH